MYIFCFAEKSAKHGLLFIFKGIFDQISIALNFIILGPEFKRAFVKASCRVLICLVFSDEHM